MLYHSALVIAARKAIPWRAPFAGQLADASWILVYWLAMVALWSTLSRVMLETRFSSMAARALSARSDASAGSQNKRCHREHSPGNGPHQVRIISSFSP